ncbi:MAG: radical SAM/SPASM domain-containing protein [Planctomycetota bacterium]
MNELDQITAGAREQTLVQALHQGRVDPDRMDHHLLPFFVKLQIQTTSYCNAACVTCPYPEAAETQSMGRMSEELFERIVDQITGRGVERTSLFLMNEPLVDKRLEAFTAHLKDREPDTKATIITNGTLLDGSRARSLAAAGMDDISVSVNGFTAHDYESTMVGLDFARIQQNLDEVGTARQDGELGTMAVRIVTLDIGDARQHAEAFHARTGLAVYMKPVTNRAGSVDTSTFDSQTSCGSQPKPCQRPFVKAYVLFDGTMLLCNCDWQRTTVIGSVAETTLEELWHGPVLDTIRRNHLVGLPADSLCAKCDYPYLI